MAAAELEPSTPPVEAMATAVPVQQASKVDATSIGGASGHAEVISTTAPTECRRCGKIFTPGPESTPGSASYYRECPETTPRRRRPCTTRELGSQLSPLSSPRVT